MALQSAILLPTSGQPIILSPNNAAATAVTLLPSRMVVITADQNVFVRFGVAGSTAAATTDFPIWAKSYFTFDTGSSSVNYVSFYNNSGNSANIYIWPLAI